MNAGVIIDVDLLIDFVDGFSQNFESIRITKINFELVVKALLVSVLPWAARF